MDLLSRRTIMMTRSGSSVDYTKIPLTFKCLTGGSLSIKNSNASYDRNFDYSLNDGAWVSVSLPKNSTVLIATLAPNDIISFRRDNDNFYQANFISDNDLTFDIYGNLLSLQYGSAFEGQTTLRNTSKQAFGPVFKGVNVVNASNLMLTALTLSKGIYNSMFNGCSLLVAAPALPATTLSEECYTDMFRGCTSLTSAPDLPALTLTKSCYRWMFANCGNNLQHIKCLATNISASQCVYQWFTGCGGTGTFVKNSNMSSWPSGVSGIPSGWTVIDN